MAVLKRQLAVEVFPSFPKGESVNDPEESGNKRVPEKKEEKFFSKGKPLCSGPGDAATSKSSGSKRKKTL